MPPSGDWRFWVVRAGRGFGKTRVGAEYIRMLARAGKHPRIHIVGPTAADVRDVMVEGESGILNCSPKDFMPTYEPSKRQLTWPNGVIAKTFSADEPDRLRGPQCSAGWLDELSAWEYPEAFTQFKLGFRLGTELRCVVTMTPKPCVVVRELEKQAKQFPKQVIIIRGSTYENRANLAPEFFEDIIRQYEGTRLGRQELDGELLEDTPGALWNTVMLERTRVPEAPEMVRIVVSIDPSVTSGEDSDECGIVVCGRGVDGEAYILKDLSGVMTPNEWARAGIAAYHQWNADCIIAETNNGGDLVGNTLMAIDSSIAFRKVNASRGKHLRAEPISALFEQGRAHLAGGDFARLEEQMCAMAQDGYTGRGSPDRLDAAVHGLTDLMLGGGTVQMFPDFRPKRRPNEPPYACHVATPGPLKDWWPRYVSATYGGSSAAHWWCQQPSGRLVVYRELLLQDATPEALGAEIAKLSIAETGAARMVPVWLSEKTFERVNGKHVAALIADGIAKNLGENRAFLFVHNDEERQVHDAGERYRAIESRLNKMPRGFLNVQALRGTKEQFGWDIIRELLRWSKGTWNAKPEQPDWEHARELAAKDHRAYVEYMAAFVAPPEEINPLLMVSPECPALIQVMSGASRNPSDETAAVQTASSYVLQSLRIGALASREDRITEPKDEFVGKRLDRIPDEAGIMARVIAAERAEKQWTGTQDAGPVSFRRV